MSYNRRKALEFKEWVDAYKLERGCVECGYKEHAVALHFDHLDPSEKLYHISSMKTHRHEKVLAEIAKCQILCANCHAVKTFENAIIGELTPKTKKAENLKPKTCINGHPWTQENRIKRKDGRTNCRVCARIQAEERRDRAR